MRIGRIRLYWFGYADDGDGIYDITFELNGTAYLVKDITKIEE